LSTFKTNQNFDLNKNDVNKKIYNHKISHQVTKGNEDDKQEFNTLDAEDERIIRI